MGILKRVKDHAQGKVLISEQPRSDKWPTARKNWLAEHSTCAVCGGKDKLEVHHKKPFHLNPELELDPNNFISLCEGEKFVNCHLTYGHLSSFRSFNVNVKTDAVIWNDKFKTKPKGDGTE